VEPTLGEFDDDFTWSAEVLAAQGRRADQISLEEIDWLGRLRRGLEKTRQGFVTGLLENLGDDPLTPEVLDELETLLLRADAGVQATDQVLEALRQRMNEDVVDPVEGIRFLKDQLRGLLDAPIKASGVPLLAPERGRLNIWLMVGVNGVGKTTTLGKLANLAVRSGYSALIAAQTPFGQQLFNRLRFGVNAAMLRWFPIPAAMQIQRRWCSMPLVLLGPVTPTCSWWIRQGDCRPSTT
jgi:fused signal recognition particle receptor